MPTFVPAQSVSVGTDGRLLTEGRITVTVHTSAISVCPNGQTEVPEGVELRVYDPLGRELAHEVDFRGDHAHFTVDALEAGWYHVEAEFLPSFGLSQLEFLVMRAVEPTAETVIPRRCARLERLGDAWICDETVIHDGGVNEDPPLTFNRWTSGDRVWTSLQGRFQRFRYAGAGALTLEAEGNPLSDTSGIPGAINAAGELFLRDSGAIYRLRPAPDGGVDAAQIVTLTSGFFGTIAVDGPLALIDEFGPTGPVLNTYGPLADGGYGVVGSPRPFQGNLQNISNEALWSFGFGDLRTFAPSVAGPVSLGSLVLPQDLTVQHLGTGRPLITTFSTGFPIAVLIAGEADSLELVRLVGPSQLHGAAADFAWQHTFDGDGGQVTRVFEW